LLFLPFTAVCDRPLPTNKYTHYVNTTKARLIFVAKEKHAIYFDLRQCIGRNYRHYACFGGLEDMVISDNALRPIGEFID
jgi:hypothetical protein